MQTFYGGSDLNQHAILHNTSISNMKLFRIRTRAIIRAGTIGLCNFSKRTNICKRKQMQKGKIQRKVGILRWREREREREGGGTGRNQQKAQASGLAK